MTDERILELVPDLFEVEYLDLSRNSLTSAEFLIMLPNLREVNLDYNNISVIPVVGDRLQSIQFTGNNITDLSFILNSNLTRAYYSSVCLLCDKRVACNYPQCENGLTCKMHSSDGMVVIRTRMYTSSLISESDIAKEDKMIKFIGSKQDRMERVMDYLRTIFNNVKFKMSNCMIIEMPKCLVAIDVKAGLSYMARKVRLNTIQNTLGKYVAYLYVGTMPDIHLRNKMRRLIALIHAIGRTSSRIDTIQVM